MKVLLVIDTFHRGKHVLIELPFIPTSRNNTQTKSLLSDNSIFCLKY
jgi:hypothetical protein